MFSLTLLAFVAGVLTILAPCVLPLLPIIIGSSIEGNNKSKPYFVTLGLVISITLFTILLKASTLLINIDPVFWKYVSGGIVLIFGLIYLLPGIWDNISVQFGLSSKSDQVLHSVTQKSQSPLSSLLVGAALGPVFASCSPTYSLIIATVLPVNFFEGLFYIFVYGIGLAAVMLAIALLGRAFVKRLKVFSNPNGWFKKTLGIIFILVGLFIITGVDKVIETNILNAGFFDVTKIEQQLLDKSKDSMPNTQNKPAQKTSSNPAPEIVGIKEWINTSKPDGETIASLKGKVVLVDFWTYSCINCQRTLPYLTKWYDTYKDKGFVILGIHAPEFAFEQKRENVQKAVTENKINYPVGLDNSFSTWNNYSNRFWPAHYLIDKEGNIRYTHFGEGKYEETESQIQELLGESKMPKVSSTISATVGSKDSKLTPETYLGTDRRVEKDLKLTGKWQNNADDILALETGASLELNFNARVVYLVAQKGKIQVTVNGQSQTIEITEPKLYTVFKNDNFVKDTKLQIVADEGTVLNVFTFG
jgi:cytochrome c biogenesis protein CcdA/thiol-disulfide isomerase/thioredoxin